MSLLNILKTTETASSEAKVKCWECLDASQKKTSWQFTFFLQQTSIRKHEGKSQREDFCKVLTESIYWILIKGSFGKVLFLSGFNLHSSEFFSPQFSLRWRWKLWSEAGSGWRLYNLTEMRRNLTSLLKYLNKRAWRRFPDQKQTAFILTCHLMAALLSAFSGMLWMEAFLSLLLLWGIPPWAFVRNQRKQVCCHSFKILNSVCSRRCFIKLF